MMKFFGVWVSMIGFKSHLPHKTASVKFLRQKSIDLRHKPRLCHQKEYHRDFL